LIVTDGDGRVINIEPPAAVMLDALGLAPSVGDLLSEEVCSSFVAHEAEQVLAHAGLLPGVTPDPRLLRTPPLFSAGESPTIDIVTFSGGVSEYIYDREERLFNDTGRPLATAVMGLVQRLGIRVLEPAKGIRATVLGASQYSMQLSGNTVWASSEELVPIRNVPVANPRLDLTHVELDYEAIVGQLGRTLATREPAVDTDAVAIAIAWGGSATYQRIDVLSRALVATAGPEVLVEHSVPLIIVCDLDIAGLLGKNIDDMTEGGVPVLTLDGIEVSEFDYLDVGAFVPGTGALPVVVKSLLFPMQPR
jgi:ethanolamine utilization protein EutA